MMRRIPGGDAYRSAGVDVDRKVALNAAIRDAVASRADPRLLAGVGAFSGLLELSALRRPVLGATMDSVGTKLKVAIALGRHEATARDIVNHCINDLLCSGLEPVAFLDYLGMHHIDEAVVAAVIAGVRDACAAAGCALLGGETAELPDVYAPGDYDLAGCLLGAGERDDIVDGSEIRAADVVLGLPATGLHTNGYSLARRLIPEAEWGTYDAELGATFGEALLAEHPSYLPQVRALRTGVRLLGLAHITGGGLYDNLPRCLPADLGAHLEAASWRLPPIMRVLRDRGGLTDAELARAFNGGIGMAIVVHPDEAAPAARLVPDLLAIGEVVPTAEEPRVVVDGRLR